MAIEKMALVSIEGTLRKVNKTLMKCCESNCFHIVPSSHGELTGSSSGSIRTLRDKNTFAPLVKRGLTIAQNLGIEPVLVNYDDIDYSVSVDFAGYFDSIEARIGELLSRQKELETLLDQHANSLIQVDHLAGLTSDFEEIFALKFVKVRFGRLPSDSIPKLNYYQDRNFIFKSFEDTDEYVWGVYFVPTSEAAVIDDIFKSMYFERIRLPDYFHGNADTVKSEIIKLIKSENDELNRIKDKLTELRDSVSVKFLKTLSKLKALNESFDLRRNVTVINHTFFLTGYVPKRKCKEFCEMVEKTEGVTTKIRPQDSEPSVKPPVKLKNNWLFKPFEMFVKMYGLPNYNGLDPTPYVAITYMLMYGIMFGDLGQGIVISLFGLLLTKWKHAKLGPIMTRIGLSSAVFGALYGSVFGNEEILQPFFKFQSVYQLLGFDEAPRDIFQVSSVLLIAALAIGVILIVISMVLNIFICFRNRDYANALFGTNGFTGFVLYVSVVAGAALQLGMGIEMFTLPYVLGAIIFPLCILFFKEPLSEWIERMSVKSHGRKVNKNSALVHAVKTYSDAISQVESVCGDMSTIDELVECKYVLNRFGKLPLDSYMKLGEYSDKNFFFFPFESDEKTVTGVYLASGTDTADIDRIFGALGFVQEKMPAHITDISKQLGEYGTDESKTAVAKPKKSVGNFIIEGFIELFESALSYLTNTMSFLRIGGFVLSHAGLMLVVNILAGDGGVGFWIVQILGNAFVIGMEGFLVGIQVLRLEFYEIFSRFYVSDGKPFKPITVNFEFDN